MSEPVVLDPAVQIIAVIQQALLDAFSPTSGFPPEVGSTTVHFFAGEGPATAAFTAHTDSFGCDQPFLWTRLMRRFRTRSLPESAVGPDPCGLPRAIAVEIGVARCAVLEEQPAFADYEAEAVTSLEDAWRIEGTLCAAAKRFADDHVVAVDDIVPMGPEGGIIAWTGVIYATL